MLAINLLQDPKPGRPLQTGRSHRGEPCPVCKSTEKIWDVSRGELAGQYTYERCAVCERRKVRTLYERNRESRKKYEASAKGQEMLARANAKRRASGRGHERVVQNHKRWRTRNPQRMMLIYARKRAADRNLPFDLTLEDIVIPNECPALGIPIVASVGGSSDNSPTLDRIDNTKGYVRGNVWVISHRANRIKTDASLDELRLLVAALERVV